ncbi:MAG: hypothetical protein CEN88_238, partial [Candidatus Berkelbacteria bacterium Licking1014_2]
AGFMPALLEKLGINDVFDWIRGKEDPFFHGVGKVIKDGQFFDLSCDACLMEVVETMGWPELLRDKPLGQIVLITDPDGDRLVLGQVEPTSRRAALKNMSVNYIEINQEKIFAVYHPTYSFLAILEWRKQGLITAGLWNNHPRFIITTTPSSRSWDEWAKANNVAVILTPTGFKNIALIMRRTEKHLQEKPGQPVKLTDIYNQEIDLGVEPRLVFAGEESGGMITGPEKLISPPVGGPAVAMREKSAGEAAIIAAALAAHLYQKKLFLSDYLEKIFNDYRIKQRYYFRADITYYNESEPDPNKLLAAKAAGEKERDRVDGFYLGLALGIHDGLLDLAQAKEILSQAINPTNTPGVQFGDLEAIRFAGDAAYLEWPEMFVQIRRSGTDAKLRGYSGGADRERAEKYLDKIVHYNGEINELYDKLIPLDYRQKIYERQQELYNEFYNRD